MYEAFFKQRKNISLSIQSPSVLVSLCLQFPSPSPPYFPFLFRHNQRSLEVQKDSVHKNRCHVRFPEVFSSFPYKVNVTAVNALGKAYTTISFEESSIGKIQQMTRHVLLCCFLFRSSLPVIYSVRASDCTMAGVVIDIMTTNFPLPRFNANSYHC